MTYEELMRALAEQVPVCAPAPRSISTENVLHYKRISAVIKRNVNGKVIVQAELLDSAKNAVVIEDPKNIMPEERK